MNPKRYAVLFTAVVLLSIAAHLFLTTRTSQSKIATIYQNQVLIETIDLSQTAPPRMIYITDGGHENHIEVVDGAVAVVWANCPTQICVAHGPIRDGLLPIICLPHRLVISIAE